MVLLSSLSTHSISILINVFLSVCLEPLKLLQVHFHSISPIGHPNIRLIAASHKAECFEKGLNKLHYPLSKLLGDRIFEKRHFITRMILAYPRRVSTTISVMSKFLVSKQRTLAQASDREIIMVGTVPYQYHHLK